MPMPNKTFRGVESHQEVKAKDIARDTRPKSVRYAEKLQKPDNLIMVMGMILLAAFVFPLLSEVSMLVGLGLLYWLNKRTFTLPFRMPKTSGLPDPNDLHPGHGKPEMGGGIAFLGNELNTRKEIWFKNDDMRTHLLVFGSTGAGKTEALVSIAFNALVQGSGFIYVDGKGDSSLFAKIFSMARSVGREDDVLVINYMTGSRDVFGPQTTKLSNTMNPFATGSSGGLTELLVSLMDDSGGDNAMWKGRAISLISALMMGLVHMREQKEILLDVEIIRKTLVLEEIIKMASRRDLPPHVLTSLNAYLRSLPGYVESKDPNHKQSETVMDQHGYLQMQFTRILGSLGDSYGYIFKTNLGEVDFWDVVVNRRILVVLLPALEKSPEELANLGKIVVASLKQMMSSGLGAELEGLHKEIIESKPTVSRTPFMCILDEYGYYSVKGAAVMPAQARSLGFCMIFAGQDYPAFEKASKEEAASTIANCNIKIFMKLEDPKDTYDLFAKSLGETYVTHVSGFEMQQGGGGYAGMKNANIEKRQRGDLQDLQMQAPGEAHIIFKGGLVRAKMFYAAPKESERYQLNYFLKVAPPEKIDIEEMDKGLSDLREKLLDETFMTDIEDSTDPVQDIDLIKQAFEEHQSLSLMEQGAVAVAAHQISLASQIEAFRRQMGQMLDNEEEDDSSINIFKPSRDMREAAAARAPAKPEAKGRNAAQPARWGDERDDDYGYEEDDEEEPDGPLFLDQERARAGLARIEELGGETPENSQANATRLVEDMKAVSEYPRPGAEPEAKSSDDILEMLKELDQQMDEIEQGDEDEATSY